ncbi:tetratricopeptide repeat protein [Actinosynnema sp. NPDC020468]|uniref:tetratricopeptide repeat protein n=1 Tax=Actinosynnema sp. NPDC020468 TaxID=3154488 RepID=UPI00340D5E71
MTAREPRPEGARDVVEVHDSGAATADNGGVANTGVMGDVRVEHHHHPPAAGRVWPVVVGSPPPLASAFQPRVEVRERVLAARRHGEDVVLTQEGREPAGRGGAGTRVLAGGGGVGKSQLAAWFAERAVAEGADLVVWVNASTPEQVITAYATAALRVGAPGADGSDPAADAEALTEWLRTTDRSWLVVLDDVTDSAHLTGLWPPHREGGWTLATTRLREAALTGSGRRRVDVDTFTPAESVRYLRDRLTGDDCAHLLEDRATELADALGHLPLALSHAAAYLLDQHVTCAAYLARYTAGDQRLDELMPAGVDPDAYGRPVAVALLLSLDAADTRPPVGLARPALALAAVCDPDGHPDTLWATPPVTDYLTAHRTRPSDDGPVTAEQARKALRTLHRYGLLVHTPAADHHAVRIHALTARATRETATPDPATVARAAADALLHLWPDNDRATTDLLTTLIANTTTLATVAGDLLWHPDGHPLLYEAGNGLLHTGLQAPAITYWHNTMTRSERILGPEHLHTLTARGSLAVSYSQAGRTDDAITIEERLVVDMTRLLGPHHPSTLTCWGNLAASYGQAGRMADAITIDEQVSATREHLLGEEHPDTLTARLNVAASYGQAGRTDDAIAILERLVVDMEHLVGREHPDTLDARHNLAASYGQAGRTDDAIAILEQLVVDMAGLLGEQHPGTLMARGSLANAYGQAGRTDEAITIERQVIVDRTRLLGEQHPHILTEWANLAATLQRAGRVADAIGIQEQVLADRERLLGEQHPDTLTARAKLALYRKADGPSH